MEFLKQQATCANLSTLSICSMLLLGDKGHSPKEIENSEEHSVLRKHSGKFENESIEAILK